MNFFAQADRIMIKKTHNNYLTDPETEAIDDLMDRFTESDWQELQKLWRQKPEYWQARCAQALDSNVCDSSFEILCEFLESPIEKSIFYHAIYSLKRFSGTHKLSKHLTPAQITNIQNRVINSDDSESSKASYLEMIAEVL